MIKFHFWRDMPITVVIFFIVIAPQLNTHHPIIATEIALASPSPEHWLGTDRLGRDVWSRLITGGQITLGTALLASTVSITFGLALAIANILSITKLWGSILKDALLAFPGILIALMIRSALDGSWISLGIAIGIANIANYAHVAVGALINAQKAPHIEGAYSIGARPLRIITRHILPTAFPTLAAFGAVIFAWSIGYGSALAFLGLGESPSTPEWGMMIRQGQGVLMQAPHLFLLPGTLIGLHVWLTYRFAEAITAPLR